MKDKEYKVYSFRLNDETVELFRIAKDKIGKSWNLTLYEILKNYMNDNKNKYRENFKKRYQEFQKDFCEICGIKNGWKPGKYLVIHHIDGDITNNKENNLKTLCQGCHAKQYPR